MVVRFEYMWVTIPMLLVPLLFVLIQMVIIRIWMLSAPVRERERPSYSLHVMREPTEKPKKMTFAPQQPVIPARRTPMFQGTYQVANAPHVYGSNRSTPMSSLSSASASGWATPSMQFQQFQSGRATPQYGRPPQYGTKA